MQWVEEEQLALYLAVCFPVFMKLLPALIVDSKYKLNLLFEFLGKALELLHTQ